MIKQRVPMYVSIMHG